MERNLWNSSICNSIFRFRFLCNERLCLCTFEKFRYRSERGLLFNIYSRNCCKKVKYSSRKVFFGFFFSHWKKITFFFNIRLIDLPVICGNDITFSYVTKYEIPKLLGLRCYQRRSDKMIRPFISDASS